MDVNILMKWWGGKMLEAIIVILGMCLIFVPVILYVRYLLTHVLHLFHPEDKAF